MARDQWRRAFEPTYTDMNAVQMMDYCITCLEGAGGWCPGVDWDMLLTPDVSLEEVIGALVHGRAELDKLQNYIMDLEEDIEDLSRRE